MTPEGEARSIEEREAEGPKTLVGFPKAEVKGPESELDEQIRQFEEYARTEGAVRTLSKEARIITLPPEIVSEAMDLRINVQGFFDMINKKEWEPRAVFEALQKVVDEKKLIKAQAQAEAAAPARRLPEEAPRAELPAVEEKRRWWQIWKKK